MANDRVTAADAKIRESTDSFGVAENKFEELRRLSINLDQDLVRLLRLIPTDRAALASAEDEIDTLRRILESDRLNRDDAAREFNTLIDKATKRIQKLQSDITREFEHFIKLFLLEDAALVYQTVQARVAQSLTMFTFPVFRLAMGGAAVPGTVVREGLDAVSQSQAEFVDLAFRMALMTIASEGGATLVVDAPEASLDFLFATRGGHQLAAFSRFHRDNRVIVTSYLPSHHFVTALLSGIRGTQNRRKRVINLIDLAAQNAALRADKPKYARFLKSIIAHGGRAP